MIRQSLCVLLLLSIVTAQADEQVRSLQEELRRRNIYFGDVDGRRSAELEEALKRYQRRKGFVSHGREDQETLQSLGLAQRDPDEPPPRELPLPDGVVLRSDPKIDVEQEAAHIAEEAGVAPEAIATLEPAPDERGTSKKARAKRSRTPVTRAGAPPSTRPSRSLRAQQGIEPRELRSFVTDYLRAVSRDNLQAELRFYADRVDYFANGLVDRRIIERTLRDYYKRWPKRKYTLGRVVQYAFRPTTAEIVVTFRVSFYLKDRRRTVRGDTDNRFVINAATADPRIVAIREQRVRR